MWPLKKGVENIGIQVEGGGDTPRVAGSLLRGTVRLSVASLIRHRRFVLTLQGYIYHNDADYPLSYKLVDYFTYLLYPTTTVQASSQQQTSSTAVTTAEGSATLASGNYSYPFFFLLPPDLLPTLKGARDRIQVRYVLTATLVREGTLTNTTASQDITIRSIIPRTQFISLNGSFVHKGLLPMTNGLWTTNGSTELMVELSTSVLVLSHPEDISVKVHIDNTVGKKPIAANAVQARLGFTVSVDLLRNGKLVPVVKELSLGTCKLLGDPIPAGGHAYFDGKLPFTPSAGDSQTKIMPSFLSDWINVEWFVVVQIASCSKEHFVPISAVQEVDEADVVPWFHGFEKPAPRMHDTQSYEVPSQEVLGEVVGPEGNPPTIAFPPTPTAPGPEPPLDAFFYSGH
jgi:hypothetical protein